MTEDSSVLTNDESEPKGRRLRFSNGDVAGSLSGDDINSFIEKEANEVKL